VRPRFTYDAKAWLPPFAKHAEYPRFPRMPSLFSASSASPGHHLRAARLPIERPVTPASGSLADAGLGRGSYRHTKSKLLRKLLLRPDGRRRCQRKLMVRC